MRINIQLFSRYLSQKAGKQSSTKRFMDQLGSHETVAILFTLSLVKRGQYGKSSKNLFAKSTVLSLHRAGTLTDVLLVIIYNNQQ